jgi:PST family polysaccharide transporter
MALNIKKESKLKSVINLTLIQLSLYLFPLIVVPYIVSRVGIEKYGNYMFFQTVVLILAVIVNYGFPQSGVRDIAVKKGLKYLNYEFSNIFYSKFFMTLVAILLGLFFLFFKKFNSDRFLYVTSLLLLIVNFLDMNFVYQGIEKLVVFVNLNLIGSILSLVMIFSVIKTKADYIYLPVVYSLPRILILIISVYVLYWRFGIYPADFLPRAIFKKLKKNLSLFVSNVFMLIYTRGTIVILGLITNGTYVGYYAIADQIVYAYSCIISKISTVFQPQVAQGFKHSLQAGIAKARENILAIASVALAGFAFTQVFSYEILTYCLKTMGYIQERFFYCFLRLL